MIKPFETKNAANYWGGGVLIEDPNGGWWSLHAWDTPAGPQFRHIGTDQNDARIERPGWPKCAQGKFAWATPNDGGRPTICRID